MKLGRRGLALTQRMAGLALVSLSTIALAFPERCRADEATVASEPAAGSAPAAPAPDSAASTASPTPPDQEGATPRVFRHGPVRHLTPAQSIDESVRRLAHGLDLDASQQLQLRQILVDQRRQIVQLRTSGSASPGDMTGKILATYDRTRARIRAMLNEEQLKKYPPAVPRDQTAPAQADLQHWLDIQDSGRKQGDGTSK